MVSVSFALSVPRENGLVARKTGCPLSPNLIITNSATLSHSPPGLSLQVKYTFVSDPGPRMTNVLLEIFLQTKTQLWNWQYIPFHWLLIHHMVSKNIDMKIIRPWNCSGSPILFMNFWTSWTFCNVVNPGKYSTRIPLAHHQLCPKLCIVMKF